MKPVYPHFNFVEAGGIVTNNIHWHNEEELFFILSNLQTNLIRKDFQKNGPIKSSLANKITYHLSFILIFNVI